MAPTWFGSSISRPFVPLWVSAPIRAKEVDLFPSSFEYAAPHSLEEALSTLSERADEAKVLAGGQSLIPLMKLRFASPALIVDLNRIPGLSFIEESGDHLRVGALTRNSELAASELLETSYPAMAAAAPLISDPIVRNLGTIGGSLAHADPAGDWGSVMIALGAEVVARGPSGERTIPVTNLIVDTFTTSLEPDEIITEVRIPKSTGRSGGTYLKLERKVGDFATVGVAVQLDLDDGNVARAGIALTAVGSKNLEAAAAQQALAGVEPSADAFEEAGRLAAEAADPISDVRGSADYKRAVVRTFVKRGLDRALELARD
jgi:aerobic carbon-monoxide dehydrogenase medium subunit